MTDWFLEHLYFKPARMRAAGWLLLHFGALLLFAGAIGQLMLGAQEALLRLAPKGQAAAHGPSLASAYSAWPTWWVPEGPMGYLVAFAAVGLGVAAVLEAKRISRLLR